MRMHSNYERIAGLTRRRKWKKTCRKRGMMSKQSSLLAHIPSSSFAICCLLLLKLLLLVLRVEIFGSPKEQNVWFRS